MDLENEWKVGLLKNEGLMSWWSWSDGCGGWMEVCGVPLVKGSQILF